MVGPRARLAVDQEVLVKKSLAPVALLAACGSGTGGEHNIAAYSESGQSLDCTAGRLAGLIERDGELFPELDVVATSSHDSSPARTTADAWGAYEVQLAAEIAWSVKAVAEGHGRCDE